MAKLVSVRATANYHGSDGYRKEGETWEVSEDEAKALDKSDAHPVELVKTTQKEAKEALTTKEDKTITTTKNGEGTGAQ